MADLNNTIVRGKLRVTEDINANGNIAGNGVTLSNVKNAGILGTDSSGKVYNNSSAYVTYDNASKDVYLGSHGIYSGVRPSSGGVTLAGNGYWIKPSSVGVSSAIIGGGAETSEMAPNYVSVSNGKIKLNSSGIVSDAGTFTFDGNPGSVATTNDLKNYATIDTAQTITGNWTFTGTTNLNGTTKVNGNEIASKGYVDGIFDGKLNASEAKNFAKFTKFDNDTLKMTGARLYRTSAGDAVDRSSMYGYSSQSTHGTTYTRFAGMATIGSSRAFIGYYQYTNHADGSGGEYIGNITLSNGRLARINGSLDSVNELTDAYAVLSDLNNYQPKGNYVTTAQLNAKLDKTTYEWNKEFAAGSNGAISLGRYNIYDSQLTFDITSTTNQSISGKLVIATQNGTIHQAKVFGDATGALVSKLIIYQSAISNSRSWVEVFCNFNGWSKNKVHIYAVALNSATVQKQMTSVTISNGVPSAANITSGDTK